MVVVDLGAAPGGWSQWVRQALGGPDQANPGRLLALDIRDMPPLAGVEFLHGDFREDVVLSTLDAMLEREQVDLVFSEMAATQSGLDAVVLPRSVHLAELAMDFADHHLRTCRAHLITLYPGVAYE